MRKLPNEIRDDADGYQVIKRCDINIVRQTIRLDTQDDLIPVFERVAVVMRDGGFTGKQVIFWNQGGVACIDMEQELK